MQPIQVIRRVCGGILAGIALISSAPSAAHQSAHVHGLVRLDLAIEAKLLSVQIQAPLDSLLGFEHRPRTAAQKAAAENLLKQMNNSAALIRPPQAANCQPSKVSIQADALQPSKPAAKQEEEHNELEASFEFNCENPEQLSFIEIAFFDTFKRIQKIEVQMVGVKGQAKQVLKRPDRILKVRQ